MLGRNLVGREGPLGFIEDEHMFRRNEFRVLRIPLDIRLHCAHECFAVTLPPAQLVLQDPHERAIAREIHGGGGGLSACSRHG